MLVAYPSQKRDMEEYTIPNTVTNIVEHAFYGNNSLKKIIIPESITNIGNRVFL